MIRCTRCQQDKPESDFRWMPRVSRYHSHCRACERLDSAESRERRQRRESAARSARRYRLSPPNTTPMPRLAVQGLSRTGRAFGVELELTSPDPDTLITALRAEGIEVANSGTSVMSYQHTNRSDDAWSLKRDSSVAGYGLELVSPKLSGEWGRDQLKRVCKVLRQVRATVDTSTGLHVHHDFSGLSFDEIKRQVLPVLERQHLWMQAVAPSRRHNSYCAQWTTEQVARLCSASNLQSMLNAGPRGALNVHAYSAHSTIEIRAHNGSTRFDRIIAWIDLFQALFAEASSSFGGWSVEDDFETLLRRLYNSNRITGEENRTLLRFRNAALQAEQRAENDEYAEVI